MLLTLISLLVLSAIVGYIGKDRKFGFWGYMFCSLIFTPLIGLVIVFASDKRPIAEATSA